VAAKPVCKEQAKDNRGPAGSGGFVRIVAGVAKEDIPLRSNVGFLLCGVLIGAIAVLPGHREWRRIDLTALPLPPRIERACGPSGQTAVIVIHGQSNAANYGSSRYAAREAVDNFDAVTGKCFAAVDPLLGTDGAGGNFATRLGDILIQTGRYKRVVVVPIAVEGASLSVLNGEHAGRIDNVILKLKAAGLVPTHLLFQQGEKDAMLTTTQEQYVSLLHRLVTRFRAAGIDAPFYVSQSTKCDAVDPKNFAAVRAAQESAIDDALNVRRGPDTDMIGNDGRNPNDGCHMNESGTLATAALWAAFIR
jgi:hypothetical protein